MIINVSRYIEFDLKNIIYIKYQSLTYDFYKNNRMEVKVFGCKVNKYYTDAWLTSDYLLGKTGIFIASCVVTDQAKFKWIRFVKQSAKHLKDEDKIFITGCGAFESGEAQDNFFELYPDLDLYRGKIILL